MFGKAAAVLVALSLPGAALAQAKPCLSPAEATAVFSFMMPDVVATATDRCRAHLPTDAYLTRSGTDLVARFRVEANGNLVLARLAFAKLLGKDAGILKSLDDETIRKVFAAGIIASIGEDIKPATCPDIDRFVTALDPLPASNVTMLIGALAQIMARDVKMQQGSFPLCPPSTLPARP